MKHDIIVPILDLTSREAKRDNLLSSSCQEIFENMRRVRFRTPPFVPETHVLAG